MVAGLGHNVKIWQPAEVAPTKLTADHVSVPPTTEHNHRLRSQAVSTPTAATAWQLGCSARLAQQSSMQQVGGCQHGSLCRGCVAGQPSKSGADLARGNMPSMMSAPALSTNMMTRFQGDLGTPADVCGAWDMTHHQQHQQQQQKPHSGAAQNKLAASCAELMAASSASGPSCCTAQACALVCRAYGSQLALSSMLFPAMCTGPSPGRKRLWPEPLTGAGLPREAGVAEPAAGQGIQVVHTPRALAQLGS